MYNGEILTQFKPTIVFLTTYPPRECGIATFTQDLLRSCKQNFGNEVRCKVAAFNVSLLDTYKYPHEVAWEIDQNSSKDYLKLAHDINADPSVSHVVIQHEYGIYGGAEGEKLLLFMQKCKKPILVTLHTVTTFPKPKRQEVTSNIIELAHNIVVLTSSSKKIVEQVYPNSQGKVFVIPHGIHEVPFSFPEQFKEKLELSGHTILSTFGLLSRKKGIEYTINALPSVIKKHPSVLFLILGETHPVVRRNEGEKYRLELAKLIRTLGLKKYVKFYDQYLSLSDLLKFLQATDIYMATSINPDQTVSGTLAYALGAGRPVISTEFAHAKEAVTPDIGRLVPIEDSGALASALSELLDNKEKLKLMARKAYYNTRSMIWSNVAQKYIHLLKQTSTYK